MRSFRLDLPGVAMAAIMLAGLLWPTPPSSHARSLQEIKASGEIRICIAPILPAYAVLLDPDCRDDCRFSGPIYRETVAFVRHMESTLRPVFRPVDWDEHFHDWAGQTDRDAAYTPHLLSTGRCDLYSSHLTKNDWRLKKVDFAILFPSRMMVIINHSRKDVLKSADDLAGKTAAVEKNTSYHTWLMQQNETTFSRNPVVIKLMSTEESLHATEKGDVDFTLVDADVALWRASHTFRNVDVAFPVGLEDEIGWAFRKEDRDLRDAVQDFFDVQASDDASELNQIWKEEFGVTLPQFKALIHATK